MLKKLSLLTSNLLLLGFIAPSIPSYAAKPIDLSHQNISFLKSYVAQNAVKRSAVSFTEIKRNIGINKTLHVRIQQTYAGYPVWGADAIVHIPQSELRGSQSFGEMLTGINNKTFMNGIIYQDLDKDLINAPQFIFTNLQAEKASQQAIALYQNKVGAKVATRDIESKMIVYIDANNKAHWAYQVTFIAAATKAGAVPAKPIYILDAITLKAYDDWNDMKTLDKKFDAAFAGGYGGNKKMGKRTYDGLADNFPKLDVERNAKNSMCILQNKDVAVKRCSVFIDMLGCLESVPFRTACKSQDPNHNNVYWNGDSDAINGGYSPSNDALFNGAVIKDLYQKWYGVPVLTNPNGTPMKLTMVVHLPKFDNAYWDGKTMNFGDGEVYFYPLTSLGVAAHEISHGFTQQHSDLTYKYQSGGMNEAYSDMAAEAAEVYAYGKNSWQIGPEIFKAENKALRYMDKPSKDCAGKTQGNCSIDDASQYSDKLDVHYTSGVYNRFFYTLSNMDDWNVRKAFDVMVEANSNYWTANSTFVQGACGAIKAASDLGYDTKAVKAAFDVVKVDTSKC